MKCMFYAYSKSISRTGRFVARNSFCQFSRPSWRRIFEHAAIRTLNLEPKLTRFHRVHSYSQTASRVTSRLRKSNPKAVMEEEKNAFFVVRKGDIVGVYNNLSDCQAQAGSSVIIPLSLKPLLNGFMNPCMLYFFWVCQVFFLGYVL